MTPWTVAQQAPLSMGFPKQEYWSGLPHPSPGDLPDPGIEPTSPALAGGFFITSTTWEAHSPPVVMIKKMSSDTATCRLKEGQNSSWLKSSDLESGETLKM